MPIWRRMALMSVERAMTSTTATRIEPAEGSSRRLQQLSKVLLPDPDGPMTKTSCCDSTTRSIPRSTSTSWNLLRRPRISRMGGAPVVINYRRVRDARGKTSRHRSAARRGVRSWIIAWHVGNAVAREDSHRGGTRRRRNAEPLFVHLRDHAIKFHAFDGDVERLAQLAGVLAQRRSPDETSRMQI